MTNDDIEILVNACSLAILKTGNYIYDSAIIALRIKLYENNDNEIISKYICMLLPDKGYGVDGIYFSDDNPVSTNIVYINISKTIREVKICNVLYND
jgi:hypothetical protein